MQRPRKRPGKVQLVERVFVDGHDDDRRRGRPLAAQLEETIQRAQLDRVEPADQGQGDHHQGGSPAGDERTQARHVRERHLADYTAKG